MNAQTARGEAAVAWNWPTGWKPDGEYHDCLVMRHERYGYITLDMKTRTASVGMTPPRWSSSITDRNAYKGRGWQQRFVDDAAAAAERLWGAG